MVTRQRVDLYQVDSDEEDSDEVDEEEPEEILVRFSCPLRMDLETKSILVPFANIRSHPFSMKQRWVFPLGLQLSTCFLIAPSFTSALALV